VRLSAFFRPDRLHKAGPIDLQAYFTVPMVDLGTREVALAGIYAPEPELGAKKVGITDQFLRDAASYHSKYSNAAHFRALFTRAFAHSSKPERANLKILDIGTSSGVNTIEPCLEMFPGCEIIATDLSPQLLCILRAFVVQSSLEARVAAVCTDTMRNFSREGSFDLVVGASILYHLMDPVEALKAAITTVS
jgi:2-polyprenyl-3-methyl-5-hydroxy-6-metoxy-1,4-benzoquinol methylase